MGINVTLFYKGSRFKSLTQIFSTVNKKDYIIKARRETLVMETQKYRHMISVVVPVYNAQEYLAVMIESLLNQSYAKWELILVENGSRDGSF